MKTLFLALLGGALSLPLCAQRFDDFFEDKTLRLDYVFAGTAKTQQLYVGELCVSEGWFGRRTRLAELPLAGNGQITVCDEATGDTLYRHSFSSLFQEWQTTEEASRQHKSFENSFLVPFPKRPVQVTVTLSDTHRRESCRLVHRVVPSDILIRHIGDVPLPHRYVHRGGDPKNCIDVAFVPEGYTSEEMPRFLDDCRAAVDALFGHEPFASSRRDFNFVAVEAPSLQSGVSVPAQGLWRQTAVHSHFSTFYSDRYLTTLHIKELHNLLAGIPYEHIIILANTDTYGGGGIYNSYTLTTAHHSSFAPVVVHEFGHSFGGLGDEYFYDDAYEPMYPAGVEPWEPNLTTLVDFDTKWRDMLPANTPIPTPLATDETVIYRRLGVFEGGGYQSKGVYRPAQECRMKINEAPAFCPVCRRALQRLIDFYTE